MTPEEFFRERLNSREDTKWMGYGLRVQSGSVTVDIGYGPQDITYVGYGQFNYGVLNTKIDASFSWYSGANEQCYDEWGALFLRVAIQTRTGEKRGIDTEVGQQMRGRRGPTTVLNTMLSLPAYNGTTQFTQMDPLVDRLLLHGYGCSVLIRSHGQHLVMVQAMNIENLLHRHNTPGESGKTSNDEERTSAGV